MFSLLSDYSASIGLILDSLLRGLSWTVVDFCVIVGKLLLAVTLKLIYVVIREKSKLRKYEIN